MRWNAAELRPRDLEAIDSWPLTMQLTVDGIGDVLFCHATPRNDTEIFLKTTSDEKLRPIFDSLGVQLVVCGHTHMQFDRIVGRTRIVNAGSVGMPFQAAGAYWALLGPACRCGAPPTISIRPRRAYARPRIRRRNNARRAS